MTRGAAFSAIIHVSVALLVYFGAPSLFAPVAPIETTIPVAVYTIRELTNLPSPEPEAAVEPEAAEPEQAEITIPPAPEPIEAVALPPEPRPPPVLAAAPPPPPPTYKPEPSETPPPPPPKPLKLIKAAKAAPKPEPKPAPPPKPDRFASLLKSVEASAQKPRTAAEAKPAEPSPAESPPVTTPLAPVASTRDAPLSLSVLDAIRRQVEENWSLPAGAREAHDLLVEIHILLLSDGTVRAAEIVDTARLDQPGEEFFRSMAESAVRAVRRSSPFRDLPPEKYEQWREITFRFRPPV